MTTFLPAFLLTAALDYCGNHANNGEWVFRLQGKGAAAYLSCLSTIRISPGTLRPKKRTPKTSWSIQTIGTGRPLN